MSAPASKPGGGGTSSSSSPSSSAVTGRPPKVSSDTPPWRSILHTKEKAPNGLHSKALAAKMAASCVSCKTRSLV